MANLNVQNVVAKCFEGGKINMDAVKQCAGKFGFDAKLIKEDMSVFQVEKLLKGLK